ncbi:MAG: hypothetical protein NTZ56_13025 [Acidobacteria bacterium]|nr:hypothetical protein [Acidobacteriota bacterium]
MLATAAYGQVNASKIVTGTQTSINWLKMPAAPNVPVSQGFSFRGRAQARVAGESSGYYASTPWYQPFSPSPSYPELDRYRMSADYIKSGQAFHYLYNPAERGQVDLTPLRGATPSAQVLAQTAGSGEGSANLSYALHLQHSGAPASYFLSIRNPKRTRSFNAAIDYPAGGYNSPAVALRPEAVDTRVAVDILAGTIPFYSSEATYHYPPGATPYTHLDTDWGSKMDGQYTVIYLGQFNAGDSATLNFIVRADVRAKAPKCGLQWGIPGPWVWYCSTSSERLQVGEPGDSSTIPAITVFAKSGL